ncbi:uncharacterized protein LAJ45_06277 [Morchella importuna]|uniref:Thioredoxin-like protein n=1 Tax=Morchella conica CCBAS932 TaxID=1392247 RepID=A0A3N4LAA9_9PEZI|nr:uncharacterized protein LAJ45_06277 [Morchella importuna]KAH8149646.1 hypothetical protein LAJ45_06277 [Morchella importuna]RPB17581.1 thioredoxin-like protein [Morchella conica CCBAS932]
MSAELDPTVAKVLDKERPDAEENDDKEDELLDELEADEAALDAFREKRMQQLHDEMMRARQMRDQAHGGYEESTSEKEVMDFTTSTKYTIIHFFHPDFRRCQIMDTHLSTLAPKHFDTRFARIHVENAPFLVERLKIVVLPCLISFIDGKSVDRIEGFAELGNTDNFSTAMLENRLLACGVLQRAKTEDTGRITGGIFKTKVVESDDDDDWD